MTNKVPSFVRDENEQRRLTLAGRFAMSAGALSDEYVAWLLKNENHAEIPELLVVAANLGRDQRIALKESVKTDSPRIAIPGKLAKEWESFWKDEYGIKTDCAGLQIPSAPLNTSVPHVLILMPEKASQAPEMLYQSDAKAYGKAWKFTSKSLDELGMTHKLTGTFGFWVADVEEAPDGLVGGAINLSTAAVDDIRWVTETLPMRQVHGRKYWREQEIYLDQRVITFCAGSRLPDGSVPTVGCDPALGRVDVCALDPRCADDYVRFRRAGV